MIDLITRKDGRYQLAVVSHYPTESVEMFELQHDENWTGMERMHKC